MDKHRQFRFSKGGYSLYAQLDDSTGVAAVRYLVFNAGDELMDDLPSLGEASALIERLAQSPAVASDGAGSRSLN